MNLPPPAVLHAQLSAGDGANVREGGNDSHNGDEDMEDNNLDESSLDASDKGNPKDPKEARMGKFYKTQTQNMNQMVKMFKRFCDLTDCDANTIVMYFGVYSEACLAEFLHDHWKNTFTQWQKRLPTIDGTE